LAIFYSACTTATGWKNVMVNASITNNIWRPLIQTTTSKLTKKYQATTPEPVRKILHLEAGDAIAFDIEGKNIQLRKARTIDMAFAESIEGALSEWLSEADEEAYRDLFSSTSPSKSAFRICREITS
jgi:bifunctional DNA-binding transcriptional regulator/antitoxin component of YhaV-PrlF toxin-antitoxin module